MAIGTVANFWMRFIAIQIHCWCVDYFVLFKLFKMMMNVLWCPVVFLYEWMLRENEILTSLFHNRLAASYFINDCTKVLWLMCKQRRWIRGKSAQIMSKTSSIRSQFSSFSCVHILNVQLKVFLGNKKPLFIESKWRKNKNKNPIHISVKASLCFHSFFHLHHYFFFWFNFL